MPLISKIQIPGNSTPYNLKDSSAVHGIKTVNSTSLEGSGNVEIPDDQMIWFGTCSTSASTATKTIVLADSIDTFSLVPGHTLRILFSYGNTTSSQVKFTCTGAFTNINAYSAYDGTTYSNLYYMWQDNEVVDFVYDGTQFIMVDGAKANTSNYGLVKLTSSTSSSSTTLGTNIEAFSAAITKYQSRTQVYTPAAYQYSTSFTLYNDEYGEIIFRKYGHFAEISGWVKPKATISGSASLINITDVDIPSDYRPSQDINLIMAGSTYYIWLLRIRAEDGLITFSRYRCTNSYASAGTSASLPFYASWIFE